MTVRRGPMKAPHSAPVPTPVPPSHRRLGRSVVAFCLGVAALGASASAADESRTAKPERRFSLLLITVDTLRADSLGSYGDPLVKTPTIDTLAHGGTRYERALTPSPLTLPAHTSILTGLDPPQHGVRDNGIEALPAEVPTLATILQQHDYATGAFVSSRVLDRRFGLARGFDRYDDQMSAERIGQYGYPERDAAAVTGSALQWLAGRPADAPFFLWVHYYDPHAPYSPPPPWRGTTPRANYRGEIAYVDTQVARLVRAVEASSTIVAVTADHGEALGEHGEEGHGIFLYEASLHVPLILRGPSIGRNRTIDETVGTVQLAATLLDRLGVRTDELDMHPSLPGFDGGATHAIFSETLLPAHAYGWAPLQALSEPRWRYISAPRAELYDTAADRAEADNRLTAEAATSARLAADLDRRILDYGDRQADPVATDADLDASLRSLGYLSTAAQEAGEIDPKDGIVMLKEKEQAKRWMASGQIDRAAQTLRRLVQRNPKNVTFLGQYARALFGLGRREEGIEIYRRAVTLNPKLDFLHVNFGQALLEVGDLAAAERELGVALELNPRSATAALLLAEMLARQERGAEERSLLERVAAAGAQSSGIHLRLGQLATRDRDWASGEEHYAAAIRLKPRLGLAWLLRGMNSEGAGRREEALEAYERALELDPTSGTALFRRGRLLLRNGDREAGAEALRRAIDTRLSPAEREEAERLLGSTP